MDAWLPWLLVAACYFPVLGLILWDVRERDSRMGLRPVNETLPVAVREWAKALSFAVGIIAAFFAFRQFDIARERAETDRRPWIGLTNAEVPPVASLVAKDEALFFLITAQARNYGPSPALGLGVGTAAFIHLAEDDANKFQQDLHRRTEEEGKATEVACTKAQSTYSQNAVFPNDASKLKHVVVMKKDVVNQYRSAHEHADFNVEMVVVECAAYKSTFDAKFHHTSYVLRVDIGDMNNRNLPSQSAEDQNVSIAVSPTNTYAAVAD